MGRRLFICRNLRFAPAAARNFISPFSLRSRDMRSAEADRNKLQEFMIPEGSHVS